MRTRNEIEVGKITPQQFQIYCIKALNIIFSHNKELKDLEKLGYDIYIDLIHPTYILVTMLQNQTDSSITVTLDIRSKEESIVLECNSSYEIKQWLNQDIYYKLEQNTKEASELTLGFTRDRFLNTLSKIFKLSSEYQIQHYYSPVFNPISCFNLTSNQIEHIRLTPHCSIRNIDKPQTYDGFKIGSRKQGIVVCSEKRYCISRDYDKYDNGSIYSLNNNKIEREIGGQVTDCWLPISTLISHTKIRINTPLFVKQRDSEKEGTWLYISSNGLIYGETIIKAGMEYKVIEAEKGPIELIIYKDESQELLLPLVANELLLIKGNEITTPIVLEIERVVEEDIFASESEEFAIIKKHIEELNSSLIDNKYYDGTQFEELLTSRSRINRRREEMQKQEREKKRREREEYNAMVKEKVENFKKISESAIKQLGQKTGETISKFSKSDTANFDSRTNTTEKKPGRFKEYYQKHKIGVWIGVVAIIFLVSTCG